MAVEIYALIDPRTSEVRYIGQSKNAQARRTQHYTSPMAAGNAKMAWLAEMADAGHTARTRVLERVPDAAADAAEQRWITHYLEAGAALLNVRDMPAWAQARDAAERVKNHLWVLERDEAALKAKLAEVQAELKRVRAKITTDPLNLTYH